MNKRQREKSQGKFFKDIYFSPKWRKWNKEHFLKLERSAILMWEKLDELSPKDRELAGGIAQLSSTGLKRIEEAEKEIKDAKITNRSFKLFKHLTRPSVIIITSFYKPSERKYKNNSWNIPAGLPTPKHPVRMAYMSRETIPTEGYVLKDQGKFKGLYRTFRKVTETFTGKKTYKYYVKAKSKGNEGLIYVSYAPIR